MDFEINAVAGAKAPRDRNLTPFATNWEPTLKASYFSGKLFTKNPARKIQRFAASRVYLNDISASFLGTNIVCSSYGLLGVRSCRASREGRPSCLWGRR